MSDELKPNPMKDHDLIITLVANVDTLTKSQEKFHEEVRESFKGLADNYSGRINALEGLTKWYAGALAVIGIVSTLVVYIYFYQQEIQDNKIDSIIAKNK